MSLERVPEDTTDIQLAGPLLRSGEAAASGLALIMHELATNAAKYGALASESGRLAIEWSISDEILTLVWRETGCSLQGDEAPSAGFGTSLIDRTTQIQFAGSFERLWLSEGVLCTITIPLQKLKD